MIVAAVAVSFIAALLLALTLVYAASGGQAATAATRLSKIWQPPKDEKTPFQNKQAARAQKMLQNVGKVLPGSAKAVPRTRKLLIQAGFRKPEAPLAFRGAKVLLTAGLLGWAYLSGIYVDNPFILVVAGMFGFLAPDLWLGHQVRKRQHRLRLALPDALDLMVVCVDAGLGLDQAILRVSEELKLAHRELSEEFQIMNLEMRVGKNRTDAWRALSVRTGVDDIQALVAMLIQTERFGTSIAQSLRVYSDTSRTKRRQRAEERAAKTPVKMVPVLVFFIFPALFMVILGPAVITLVRQLIPMLGR